MKPLFILQRPSSFQQSARRMAVAGLASALLAACGGGGSSATAGAGATGTIAGETGAAVTAANVTVAASAPVAQVAVTTVRVQNTGAAQTNVPFTFGHPFAPGALKAGESLTAIVGDGTPVPLQVDFKAVHPDGSARHVVVSGILPNLLQGQTVKMTLLKTARSTAAATVTLQDLMATGLTANAAVNVNGVRYTASLADAVATSKAMQWLSGGIADEWFVSVPLRDVKGGAHPQLQARFGVRWYPGLNKQARVEFIIENDKTWVSASRFTYDVDLQVAGKTVFSKTGLNHYSRARWHQYAWWDAAHAPDVNVQLNASALINSRAVPNYDLSVIPSETNIVDMAKQIDATKVGPMTIGPVLPYMPTTGGRVDIGSLPSWSVTWLLSMDKRARDVMMAAADGSGSWGIHMRDELTDFPVRTDNPKNALITTHPNMASSGPLPVPRCVNNDNSLCTSPYEPDSAHQPSLTYLPYVTTGDYYYLEELQFWAASNPIGTAPGFSGNGQGLLRWMQVRGQAWSLRTLGQAAYITPDTHPLKGYFNTQVDSNLNWYHQAFVVANPNNLGVYDGSGSPEAFPVTTSAPWQDDFLTWSFGYLNELGFTKALPILKWKAQYSVGRMTAPGYCWIMGSAYDMQMFDANHKVFNSFADLYQANFGGPTITFENSWNVPQQQSNGKFSELACGSQAQADWMGAIARFPWPQGRMIGYSDSNMGYPANMQPALAAAVTSGIPNAAQAWALFQARAAKPDYRAAPQWAILPRATQ